MATELFNMFWHGRSVSSLETVCIQSFIRHGHRLRVFTYDEFSLPAGVERADARQILPYEQLFTFMDSPSAFTNIFRYALLFEQGGWWVDSDVLCLKADLPACDYYWAEQQPGELNGAILRFPQSDPLCGRLLELGQQRASGLKRWGELGPHLMSEVLPTSLPAGHAGSTDDAYPIHWLQSHFFWVPGLARAIETRASGSTFLHFWHSQFARMGIRLNACPPKDSYLDTLYASYGVTAPQPASEPPVREAIMQYLQQDWVMRFWTDKLGRDGAELELRTVEQWSPAQ